jgi:hypothetical protein
MNEVLPYASSKAGAGREKEIRDMLKGAGATAVGFMVDDENGGSVICQFKLSGRAITVPVSIEAYEKAWLRSTPCGPRTEMSDHKRKARAQAEIAVWAVLADWIKAQTAMILCGFLNADTAFLPHIHTPDGRRIAEVLATTGSNLLPPTKESK